MKQRRLKIYNCKNRGIKKVGEIAEKLQRTYIKTVGKDRNCGTQNCKTVGL